MFDANDVDAIYQRLLQDYRREAQAVRNAISGAATVAFDGARVGAPPLTRQAGFRFGPVTTRMEIRMIDNAYLRAEVRGRWIEVKMDELIEADAGWRLIQPPAVR